MKRLFEPISGAIISFFSWTLFSDFLMSLILAFLGGMMGYFGKWLCNKAINCCTRRRNVFISKVRDRINRQKSPESEPET
jgi:hypothetical protein